MPNTKILEFKVGKHFKKIGNASAKYLRQFVAPADQKVGGDPRNIPGYTPKDKTRPFVRSNQPSNVSAVLSTVRENVICTGCGRSGHMKTVCELKDFEGFNKSNKPFISTDYYTKQLKNKPNMTVLDPYFNADGRARPAAQVDGFKNAMKALNDSKTVKRQKTKCELTAINESLNVINVCNNTSDIAIIACHDINNMCNMCAQQLHVIDNKLVTSNI